MHSSTTRPAWLAEADAQLSAIERLEAGWDSHGADAPDPELVRAARDLLESLAADPRVSKPHVNPTRSGGVQFEWEAGPRYFEIEVLGPGRGTVFYQDTAAEEEEEWEYSTTAVDDLAERVRKVAEMR